MEDLDFSNPGEPLRSAPKPQPPVYVPAIARSFFEGVPPARAKESRVFGEMALVDQSPRSASAVAETDRALLAVNRAVFLNLAKSEPMFGISLLSSMAERARNTAAALG
jgi:CRP-like cAMP-binding protein